MAPSRAVVYNSAPMKTRFLWMMVALCAAVGCDEPIPEPERSPDAKEPPASTVSIPDTLKMEDLKVGDGPVADWGDKVKVHYTGWLLKTNLKFDSSVGKEPFEFTIGNGDVIKGWDKGVFGMKVGGKRKLTIPAKLGYGEQGSPPKIPPNAPLVFDIELLEVESKAAPTASASASASASATASATPKARASARAAAAGSAKP
jgi:FKBP-type peptidyl-prolyl cis-trans isomerase FkpA